MAACHNNLNLLSIVILEGIVTTLNADGTVNISPMGPEVDEAMRRLVLKPFQTSTTYANLKRLGEGVLHVTDDVLLLAHAAVGQPDPSPPLRPAERVRGQVIANACRWYEFRVVSTDDRQERVRMECDVLHAGYIREFFGFNRAKHAVLEAAILATRVAFLPADQIASEFERLAVLVQKTGGPQEQAAFEFLSKHVRQSQALPAGGD